MQGTPRLLWGPNGFVCHALVKRSNTLRRSTLGSEGQSHDQAGGLGSPWDSAEQEVLLNALRQCVADGPDKENFARPATHKAPLAEGCEDFIQNPLIGSWVSEKGECRIEDLGDRLRYTEPMQDGQRLQGWLERTDCALPRWQAALSLQPAADGADGPDLPEPVGDIELRLVLGSPSKLQARIRVAGEDDDWQPPVTLCQQQAATLPALEGEQAPDDRQRSAGQTGRGARGRRRRPGAVGAKAARSVVATL